VQSQFVIVVNEEFDAVALNLETVAGSAERAHLGRLAVRLPGVSDAAAVGSVDGDGVAEIGAGRVRRANQVDGRVKNRVGDVLKDVDAEDLTQTRDGPVRVEQRRTVEFDVDALLRPFEEARGVGLPQMGQDKRPEAGPGARPEETGVGAEGAGGFVR